MECCICKKNCVERKRRFKLIGGSQKAVSAQKSIMAYLQIDNDPKHTSKYAQDYYQRAGINGWKTPAESPDLNPIENLWHELKEYIRRVVKPKVKKELIRAI